MTAITYPITLPSSPPPTRVEFMADNFVAMPESEFTGAMQVQRWGGERRRLRVEYPVMTRAEAEALLAALYSLRGRYGTFYFRSPLDSSPRGVATGTPIVRNRENRITKSRDMDESPWVWGGGAGVITADAAVAPDGTSTATLIEDNSGSVVQRRDYLVTVANDTATHVVSVYVKQGTAATCAIQCIFTGGTTTSFFVRSLTFASPSGTYEDVGNGWYRIAVACTNNGMGNTTLRVSLIATGTGFTASDVGSTYFWGAALEYNQSQPGVYVGTTGTAVTSEAQDAGAQVLYTNGWTASTTGILKAGDYIQLGSGASARLYKVLSDVDSDPWGNATIYLWPILRGTATNGGSIVVTNPVGVFRLQEDFSHAQFEGDKYGVAFSAVEVVP